MKTILKKKFENEFENKFEKKIENEFEKKNSSTENEFCHDEGVTISKKKFERSGDVARVLKKKFDNEGVTTLLSTEF